MLRQRAVLLAWFAVSVLPAGLIAQNPATQLPAPSSSGQPRQQQTQARPATQAPPPVTTKTSPLSATQPNTTPSTAPQNPNSAPASDDTAAGFGEPDNGNPHQPQIIVSSPPPTPSEWTWHDRVLWGAYVILAFLGYVAIMVALRTLKSIERHTESSLATSKAALGSAAAALLRTQAVVEAERPWIVVTVEPFLTVENSFKVVAQNRGRTPAQLISTVDQIRVAVDESNLPDQPEFSEEELNNLESPMILLPGESVGIRPFSRDEVNTICKTREEFERIELWEEKIFLYGKVTYRELINSPNSVDHETIWCCRYIHGESKSALVITGPPAYNHHT
ncbi:MAG TPA: hypothetical protein VG844_03655 [Terracidiphilus sp.]|nr:hypothetical protein [Terracidiphilus sp.]